MEYNCECTRESMMKEIMQLQFISVELNLYIDTHPEDEDAVNDYRCYSDRLMSAIHSYEERFGPLANFGYSHHQSAAWVSSPWPWQ